MLIEGAIHPRSHSIPLRSLRVENQTKVQQKGTEHTPQEKSEFQVIWLKLLTFMMFLLQMKIRQICVDLQLQPFNVLLRRTLDQLEEKDPIMIFFYPVTEKEVS